MVSKHKPKKIKQRSAKQFVEWLSDTEDSRASVSDFSYEGFAEYPEVESYDP